MQDRSCNAADMLLFAPMEQGTEVFFGYPGAALIPFFDSLARLQAAQARRPHADGPAAGADLSREVLTMSHESLNGADALLHVFEEEGVEIMFGFPGGQVIPIYDKLYHFIAEGRIRHILPRHEQGGVHAADGYARSTGKVGVCLATSGPGR